MIQVLHGDCVALMADLEPDSIDAIVTDPPYGLEFMGKEWDKLDGGLPQEGVWKGRRGKGGSSIGADDTMPGSRHHVALGAGKKHPFHRCTRCGKRRFSGSPCQCADPAWAIEYSPGAPTSSIRMQRWHERWGLAALRVLKPGGHLLAFGGTRTFHRLACALEDAGLEVRDLIAWVYGSGFPKSLDVSKAIDKAGGDAAAALEWQGWGTALKPALEPICVARKPLAGTVAANVQRWGTGAINVDACRVEGPDGDGHWSGDDGSDGTSRPGYEGGFSTGGEQAPGGRWPANLIHDGSAEVLERFPDDAGGGTATRGGEPDGDIYGPGFPRGDGREVGYGDGGSAARFFYTAKADSEERRGSKHPTVKPLDLMRYLVRLVTPPGGLVLDPFAGTGTTGQAALMEGKRAILIEREAEYVADIRRRLVGTQYGMAL